MGFLTEKEILELAPSELLPHPSPIPTQIVSSDEFTQHGFKPLGPADGPIKTAIFGGTNARLYNYDTSRRTDIGPDKDRFARMKDEYEKAGPARSNLRYGYVSGPVDWSAFA